MEPVVCERTPVGTTEQLIDQRDGKSYWVAKLADGKCWMTQNLALDLTTEGLTSELTDLQTSSTAKYEEAVNEAGETILKWNANSKYPPKATKMDVAFTSSSSDANDVACKSSATTADFVIAQPYVAATSSKKSTIAEYGSIVKDVTGWEPTYRYNRLKSSYSYDEKTKTYDAHYLIGNYYSSGAAYAGSGIVQKSNTRAVSSICPKGWRLPNSPNNGAEFKTLLSAYGITSKPASATITGLDITDSPLYLAMFGGNTDGTKFSGVGATGNYWSSYMQSGHYRRGLQVKGSSVDSSASLTAHPGRLIRCIAR